MTTSQNNRVHLSQTIDVCEIYEEKADHHFRTEIPNIIFDLSLSSEMRSVYCALKRIAGDSGSCWKSVKNIALDCDLSESTVRRALNHLSLQTDYLIKATGENFHLSSPLIKIFHRKKEDGGNDTNVIKIENIWPINGQFYRDKKKIRGCQTDTPPLSDRHPPTVRLTPKEDLSQEDLSKKQQTAAVVSKNIYDCLKTIEIPDQEKIWLSKNHSEEEVKHAIAWSQIPELKLTKPLAAALKWACKAKPLLTQSPQETKSQHHKDALNVETKIYSEFASFFALSDHCEIVPIGNGDVLTFEYGSQDYHKKVYDAFVKYKFRDK